MSREDESEELETMAPKWVPRLARKKGPVRLSLEVLAGPMQGEAFSFEGADTLLIGRLNSLKVSLNRDPAVSRRHCMVQVGPAGARVEDLSKNGTWINGEQMTEIQPLRSGDQIRLGGSTLSVRLEGVLEQTQEACPFCKEVTCSCTARGEVEPGRESSLLPGLTIVRALGKGANGLVWLARNQQGELVAVKTLRPLIRNLEPKAAQRFLREAAHGSKVDHPNAVRMHTSGYQSGLFYFVMEFVEGCDAQQGLERQGRPYEIREAVDIIRQVIPAVEVAHAAGLVHRDIKPANLLLRRTPEGGLFAKLADFGLMRSFEGAEMTFTATGEGRGTPAFMPPEQLEYAHQVGPPADIYGLAATLYYMLTGESPVDFSNAYHPLIAVADSLRVPLRNRLPTAPVALEQVLAKALSMDPRDRHQTVGALDQGLAGAVG